MELKGKIIHGIQLDSASSGGTLQMSVRGGTGIQLVSASSFNLVVALGPVGMTHYYTKEQTDERIAEAIPQAITDSEIADGTSEEARTVTPKVLTENFCLKSDAPKAKSRHIPTGILHHGLMPLGAQAGEVYTSRIQLRFMDEYSDTTTYERICLKVPAKLGEQVDLSEWIANYDEVVDVIELHDFPDWLCIGAGYNLNNFSCYVCEEYGGNIWKLGRNELPKGVPRVLVLNFDPKTTPAIMFTKERKIVPVLNAVDVPLNNIELASGQRFKDTFQFFLNGNRRVWAIYNTFQATLHFKASVLVRVSKYNSRCREGRSNNKYLHFAMLGHNNLVPFITKSWRSGIDDSNDNSIDYFNRIVRLERVNIRGQRASEPFYYSVCIKKREYSEPEVLYIKRIEWREYK